MVQSQVLIIFAMEEEKGVYANEDCQNVINSSLRLRRGQLLLSETEHKRAHSGKTRADCSFTILHCLSPTPKIPIPSNNSASVTENVV